MGQTADGWKSFWGMDEKGCCSAEKDEEEGRRDISAIAA